jgi:hypothetical protein
MSAPASVDAIVDHAVPMAIRWGRGNAIGFYEERAKAAVSIPGVDASGMRPVPPIPGIPDGLLAHGGGLWRVATLGGLRTFDRREATLDEALAHLGATRRFGRPDPERFEGTDAPPFRTRIGPLHRTARAMQTDGARPRSVPPERVEASAAKARLTVAAHAASGLLQDGRRLFVRVRPPMINPHDLTRAVDPDRPGFLAIPPILHTRLDPDGAIPHVASTDFFREHAPRIAATLATALEGVDLDDADVAAFVEHAPAGLLREMARTPRRDDTLRLEDELWSLAVDGSIGGIRGDALPAAVDTIVRAYGSVMEGSPSYAQDRSATTILRFAQRVARPALGERDAAPPEDLDTLGTLALG